MSYSASTCHEIPLVVSTEKRLFVHGRRQRLLDERWERVSVYDVCIV